MRSLEGEGAVVAGCLQRPTPPRPPRRSAGVTRGPSTRIARPYRRGWVPSPRGRRTCARRGPPSRGDGAARRRSTSRTTWRCGRWPADDPTSPRCPASRRSSDGCWKRPSTRPSANGGARTSRRARWPTSWSSGPSPVTIARRSGIPRAAAVRSSWRPLATWRPPARSRARSSTGCGAPTSIRCRWPRRKPRSRCGRAPRPRPDSSRWPTRSLDDLAWPELDVVVGNPPFLTPLATRDRPHGRGRGAPARAVRQRRACVHRQRRAVPAARRAQLAAPWRDGGHGAAAVGAGRPRRRPACGTPSAQLGRLVDVFVPDRAGFDAAVEVCVPDHRGRRSRRAPERDGARTSPTPTACPSSTCPRPVTLGGRGDHDRRVPHRVLRHGRPRATSSAICPAGRPLVTTGLIDLGRCAWGTRAGAGRRPRVGPPGGRRRAPSRGGRPTGRSEPADRS